MVNDLHVNLVQFVWELGQGRLNALLRDLFTYRRDQMLDPEEPELNLDFKLQNHVGLGRTNIPCALVLRVLMICFCKSKVAFPPSNVLAAIQAVTSSSM